MGLFQLHTAQYAVSSIHSTWRETEKERKVKKRSEKAKCAAQSFKSIVRRGSCRVRTTTAVTSRNVGVWKKFFLDFGEKFTF